MIYPPLILAIVITFTPLCASIVFASKLVMSLFEHIQELVDDEESFVCILIDEVRYVQIGHSGVKTL